VTPALLAPGSMLGSRWIMGGLLGQSEGAEVYEAEEAHQRRFAAIKFFDPAFAAEPTWSEHARITRALSELPGPGIARAYDIGMETAFKRPYVASERITFPTLARYVAERGPLSLRGVAQTLGALASGLDAAHAAGIVHGGLKPQNVFVSPENPEWARLTDFGVSRLRAANGRQQLLVRVSDEGFDLAVAIARRDPRFFEHPRGDALTPAVATDDAPDTVCGYSLPSSVVAAVAGHGEARIVAPRRAHGTARRPQRSRSSQRQMRVVRCELCGLSDL